MKDRVLFLLVIIPFSMIFSQPSGIPYIKVDQFGYLPTQEKVAVLSNPQTGFNASDSYIPGSTIEVRKVSDSSTAFSGSAQPWNSGATHNQSGDKVWWFDFSNLSDYGEFYIYDPDNDIYSESFKINDLVFKDALRESMRTFYYQRCGVAKSIPHCENQWSDGVCHHSSEQDLDCRLVTNPIASTSKDLSGGWHDAGDYNKYINYAAPTVHDLLFAYEFYPDIWYEDFNIPESGNGIEDILDEIKYELDWMLKMQESNGSVLHKVSAINWDDAESPPSAEGTERRYAPATASATISACGVFAHAAIIFQNHSNPTLQTYGQTLETAAIDAWDWLMANPSEIPSEYDNTGFQNAAAENTEYTQYAMMVANAAYLLVLTDDTEYRTYFDNNYQYCHLFTWSAISYNFDDPWINDGLLYYENSLLATTSVVNDIKSTYLSAMNNQYADFHPLYALNNDLDAYRAFLDTHDWGSNQYKANGGTSFISMIHYGMDAANNQLHENGAAGYIHYIHGVNPLAQNYLTNMEAYGAGNSVPEFYHLWFADGTDFDNVNTSLYGPAPGFLVGGPNENFTLDGQNLEPPENQPAQKSYLSWNTPADQSWEITENQIIYQAAYIRLLAHFIDENSYSEPENLLSNPGAESGVSPCYTFASGPAIQQSVAEQHSGDYSFLSANRTQFYHGPTFNIKHLVTGGQLTNGQRHTFSVWVMHNEASDKSLYLNIKQTDDSKGTSYITLESASCEPGIWTQIVGHHLLNYTGTLSNLELYVVSGSGQTFDFYADDFFVGETENYTPPNSSTSTDFIRASGSNLIVGASNETIVLDGINVTVPVDGSDNAEDIWDVKSISEKDFENIADLGFNAIRLHMNYVMLEDDGNPGNYKADGWHWLDRAIRLAKDAGLYVLLDMHAPQGGYQSDKQIGFSDFWDGNGSTPNTSNQSRLINLWAAIADRYKHEPTIAGYDLINEPRPNNSEEWYTFAEQIIGEIRNYDNRHLIVVEVPFIPNYTTRLIDDDNILYDSHFYYTWGYATQYSAAYGNSGQEWGKYDPDDPVFVNSGEEVVAEGTPGAVAFDDSYLENYLLGDILTFTSANSVPTNVGEFGIVWEVYAEDLGAMQYMRDLYKIFDGNNSTGKTVSRFYFSYQGNTFGLYNNWTGFQTNEDDVSENLKAFFKNEFIWTGSQGTSWDDTQNWTSELVPETNNNIVIPATANQPAISSLPDNPAKCNNLTIQSGASITINSGKALTVIGSLENNGMLLLKSDASGTGSLIQNLSNTSGQAERYIKAWTNDYDGWHILSSSVSGQAIADFHNLSTDDCYKWDEPTGYWINRKNGDGSLNTEFETSFVPGRGYFFARQNSGTPVFDGQFNASDIEITGLANTSSSNNPGWHLLGNPFSSPIIWNETNGDWNLVNIAANCQVWNEGNASYDVLTPDEIIPQANGFFVYTTGNGALTIPLSSRIHSTGTWLKSNSDHQSIVLEAVDPMGETSQKTEIRFSNEATAGFDLAYDSPFIPGYAPAFYSVSETKNYRLNTLPFDKVESEITLGFVKNINHNFRLQIDEQPENRQVILHDLKTGANHNFSESPAYNFSSENGDDPLRFKLSLSTTRLENYDLLDKIAVFSSENNMMISGIDEQLKIEIIDVSGRLLLTKKTTSESELEIRHQLKPGIYFVVIKSSNQTKTEKVVVR